MIDHTQAFRRVKALRTPERVARIDCRLWDRLRALDKKDLQQRMKGFLSGAEIRALLHRRDLLVKHLQNLIESNGESRVLTGAPLAAAQAR